MFYVNFEEHITLKFGIVLENWPLKRFAAPGSLSRVELEVLLKAWENKTTFFRQLTDEEWSEWRDAYRDGRAVLPTPMTSASQPLAAASTDSTPSSPASDVPAPPSITAISSSTLPAASDTNPLPASAHIPPPVPVPVPAPVPTPLPVVSTAPLTFLHAVTNADGSGVTVPTRPRKQRTDKNKKKRASNDASSADAPPRKRTRKNASNENVAPAA